MFRISYTFPRLSLCVVLHSRGWLTMTETCSWVLIYRGADKSLARPWNETSYSNIFLLFVRHKSWYSVVSLGRCSFFPSRVGLKTYQHPGYKYICMCVCVCVQNLQFSYILFPILRSIYAFGTLYQILITMHKVAHLKIMYIKTWKVVIVHTTRINIKEPSFFKLIDFLLRSQQ
jgi:hypothetical protein